MFCSILQNLIFALGSIVIYRRVSQRKFYTYSKTRVFRKCSEIRNIEIRARAPSGRARSSRANQGPQRVTQRRTTRCLSAFVYA